MRQIRSMFTAAALALLPAAAMAGAGFAPGPFGSAAVPYDGLPARVMAADALAEIERGTIGHGVVAGLTPKSSIRDVMERINRTVNQTIRYRTDADLYGVADHWAAPSQTLVRGAGDCEDQALLKMALLRLHGVSFQRLSLVVVRDYRSDVYHALAVVEVAGVNFILDNANDAVLRDTHIHHYQPILSLRNGGAYLLGFRTGAVTQ